MNEQEIKDIFYKKLSEYVATNSKALTEIMPQGASIQKSDIIIGEKPRFRNYLFNVTVTAPVWCDLEYWNVKENCRDTKSDVFYNLVLQPFSGEGWLMDNEDESCISICNSNKDIVKQYFAENDSWDNYYAYSDNKEVAKEIGYKEANDFVFLSTVHNKKQAYVRKYFGTVDLRKCVLNSNIEAIYIPILPIFIKLNGKKVLAGTFNIENNEVSIELFKKEIDEYNKKIENEKKMKEKKKARNIKIISFTITSVTVIAAVIIMILLL